MIEATRWLTFTLPPVVESGLLVATESAVRRAVHPGGGVDFQHPLEQTRDQHPQQNLRLMTLIDRQYTELPFYGSRRVVEWLNLDLGEQVNGKRVRRLMRLLGLEAIHSKPRLSGSDRNHKVYSYLLRVT